MKKLIFIPYHDIFDFTNTGILTREYSILKFFKDQGIQEVYFVSKPRTLLDKKDLNSMGFPSNSIEFEVHQEILKSKKFRYETLINMSLFFKKRGWWIEGYKRTILNMKKENIDYKNTIVYSNNPFSYSLLEYLKEQGAIVYFDMMDNFAIHPSLSINEKNTAEICYRKIFFVSDFVTCNSNSIVTFCVDKFNKTPILIKNGVFPIKNNIDIIDEEIKKKFDMVTGLKKQYVSIVGYIGKLGLRLDEKLIESIVKKNPKVLFVFVGPSLNGQVNKSLENLFMKYKNMITLGSISSCYINNFLDIFSILMIPHSVGEYENGGDPLKLYQYLNVGKPIITTGIEGVDEFKDIITISNDIEVWNHFIKNKTDSYNIPSSIYWEDRLSPLVDFLKMEERKIE